MGGKARYDISEETIAETKRCEKGFACLKGQCDDLCRVESCVNGKVHFIQSMNKDYCSYRGNFGESVICYCPTRKELYNMHGV